MAEFRIARREAVHYVGLGVETTMAALPERVGEGFAQLDDYIDKRGIDTLGAGLIRYREVSWDRPFTVDVGFAVVVRTTDPPLPRVREPFFTDLLDAGMYATAEQRGPYAWIGGLTKELMDWGDAGGLDYSLERGDDGADRWICWYENYTDMPVDGAQGLEGHTEVCLLLRG